MSEYEVKTRLLEDAIAMQRLLGDQRDELEQVRAESEGRRKALLEKAEALREADIRVMNLEAECDRMAEERSALQREVARVMMRWQATMRTSEPWPLLSIVEGLLAGTDILLTSHNYDGHGYERLQVASEQARHWLSTMAALEREEAK